MAKQHDEAIQNLEYTEERISYLQEALLSYHGETQMEGLNDIFEPEMNKLIEQFPEFQDLSLTVYDSIIDKIYGAVMDRIQLVATRVPFSGFYNTLNSDALDSLTFSDIGIDRDYETEMTKEQEKEFNNVDFAVMRKKYAEEYLKIISTELEINFLFIELDSPAEYNFRTDEIYAYIPTTTIQKMFEKVKNKVKFLEIVEEKFVDREGYFYLADENKPNIEDINTWGEPNTWNETQVYCVLKIAIEDIEPLNNLEATAYEEITGNCLVETSFYPKDKELKNDIPH